MSNYVVTTNFGAKDGLPSGNPAKLILGAQLTTEFVNIASAIATKLDSGGTFVTSLAGTANQIAASAATGAVTLSFQQNVIIPTPAAGVALSVVGVGTTTGFSLDSTGASVGSTYKVSGTSVGDIGSANFAVSGGSGSDLSITSRGGSLVLGSNSLPRVTIANAGNVTIATPSSGNALTVNGTGGTTASFVNGSTVLLFQGTGAGATGFGTNSAHDFTIVSGGTNRMTFGTAGNVTVGLPSSGNSLALSSTGGSQYGLTITSAASANSIARMVSATGDYDLLIGNNLSGALSFAPHGSNDLITLSAGGCLLGAGATGGVQGANTLNVAGGLFINGVAVATATTGSFTGTFTGGTTSPTPTCKYTKIGNTVTLRIPATTFISNATTFTMTGLPAAIQPATSGVFTSAFLATDNTTTLRGAIGQVAGGTLNFTLLSAGSATYGAWTASGTKGVNEITIVWDTN